MATNLPAGPALDAAVARAMKTYWGPVLGEHNGEPFYEAGYAEKYGVTPYSTDSRHVGEMLEWLRANGISELSILFETDGVRVMWSRERENIK